jgi:hypothetical protein
VVVVIGVFGWVPIVVVAIGWPGWAVGAKASQVGLLLLIVVQRLLIIVVVALTVVVIVLAQVLEALKPVK